MFFLKLDRSTDQLLARQWPWRLQPTFLDPINDPGRMVTYLQDLCWSDVVRCGRDNRKELNLAVSVIARLVLMGGQAGYLSGPGFVPASNALSLEIGRTRKPVFSASLTSSTTREMRSQRRISA